MTQDTAVRTQISMLIFAMTNAVLFGAGLITVLLVPALIDDAGVWIAAVVALSLLLAAPFSWLIAPRLRARFWRKRETPQTSATPTRAF